MQDPNNSVKLSMNMTVYEENHNIHKITFFCIKLEVNNENKTLKYWKLYSLILSLSFQHFFSYTSQAIYSLLYFLLFLAHPIPSVQFLSVKGKYQYSRVKSS